MNHLIETEIAYAQGGDVEVFKDFENDGLMWAGEGDREARVSVRFKRPYVHPPMVNLNISLLDARSDLPLRYELIPDNINESGFDIVFKTWLNSQFARVRVNWMAIGDAIREEYWIDF